MATPVRRVLELLELKAYGPGAEVTSSPELNAVLGEGERVVIHAAVVLIAGGTSTSSAELTLEAEDSSDNLNWAVMGGTPFVNATTITFSQLPVAVRAVVPFPHGRFLRIRASLDGGNPTVWMGVRATIKPNPESE